MIKINGTRITLPQGDTGLIAFTVSGATLGASDRCVFAVTDGETDLVEKVITPVDNVAAVQFANADTENIAPGLYKWDLRVVIGAVITGGKVTGGTEVHSPFGFSMALPVFEIKEVAADV